MDSAFTITNKKTHTTHHTPFNLMKRINLLLIPIALLAVTACTTDGASDRRQAPPPTVPVLELVKKDVTTFRTYPARLEGVITSDVRAKVPGYITAVLVDDGERVSKGQTLFRLETQSLTQEAEAARANVDAAEVEVNRLKPLVDKNIVSSVQLESAKARLAQAKATLSGISANIDYANIKSPVNGYVGTVRFREGALVSPADPNPLTTVSDIDEVYAFFSMGERAYLNFLQKTPGENLQEKINNFPPVKLRMVNDSIYNETGTIKTVSGQVNPTTGTVQFRATFTNPSRLLSSGNSGEILIPIVYEQAILAPEVATFERQGRVYVYVVNADNAAQSTPINVLDRVDGMVVISGGLQSGERIVASGVGKVRHESLVTPRLVSFEEATKPLEVIFK